MNSSSEEEITIKYSGKIKNLNIVQLTNLDNDIYDSLAEVLDDEEIDQIKNQVDFTNQLVQLVKQYPNLFTVSNIFPFDIEYFEIEETSIKINRLLGKGSFGKVFITKSLNTGDMCAIKYLRIPYFTSILSTIQEFIIQYEIQKIESKLFINVQFPIYIQNVVDVRIFAQIELGSFTLDEYLNSNQNINYSIYSEIAFTLIQGLIILHRNHYAHRDIKPSNILFVRNCGWKYSDFGTTIHYLNKYDYYQVVGTPAYLPKHLWKLLQFHSEIQQINLQLCDQFALKVTLAQILNQNSTLKILSNNVEQNQINDPFINLLNLDDLQLLEKELKQLENVMKFKRDQNTLDYETFQIKHPKMVSNQNSSELEDLLTLLQYKVQKNEDYLSIITQLNQMQTENKLSSVQNQYLILTLQYLDINKQKVQLTNITLKGLSYRHCEIILKLLYKMKDYSFLMKAVEIFKNQYNFEFTKMGIDIDCVMNYRQYQQNINELSEKNYQQINQFFLNQFTEKIMLESENLNEIPQVDYIQLKENIRKIIIGQFEHFSQFNRVRDFFSNSYNIFSKIEGFFIQSSNLSKSFLNIGYTLSNKIFYNTDILAQKIIHHIRLKYLFFIKDYNKIIYFISLNISNNDGIELVDSILQLVYCYLQKKQYQESVSLISNELLLAISQLDIENLQIFVKYLTQYFYELHNAYPSSIIFVLQNILIIYIEYLHQYPNFCEICLYFLYQLMLYIDKDIEAIGKEKEIIKIIGKIKFKLTNLGLSLLGQILLLKWNFIFNCFNQNRIFIQNKALQLFDLQENCQYNLNILSDQLCLTVLKTGFTDKSFKQLFLKIIEALYLKQTTQSMHPQVQLQFQKYLQQLKKEFKSGTIYNQLKLMFKLLLNRFPKDLTESFILSFALYVHYQVFDIERLMSEDIQSAIRIIDNLLKKNYNYFENQQCLLIFHIIMIQIQMNSNSQGFNYFNQTCFLLIQIQKKSQNIEYKQYLQKFIILRYHLFFQANLYLYPEFSNFWNQSIQIKQLCSKRKIQRQQYQFTNNINQLKNTLTLFKLFDDIHSTILIEHLNKIKMYKQ